MISARLVHLLVALSGPPVPEPSTEGELNTAVRFFESLEDEKAAAVLRNLLARFPPSEIAGKAHAYLGMIAINALDPDKARAEFRHALEANPALDLPPRAAPKARLAFGQVRRSMLAEVDAEEQKKRAPPTQAPPSAPADALTVPLTQEEPPPSHSHALAYVFGATTLVCAGLAIYGAVVVVQYNAMIGTPPSHTLDQIQSAHGPASFWAVGWPVLAELGAASLTGTVLTW